jgi:hypothetical protein
VPRADNAITAARDALAKVGRHQLSGPIQRHHARVLRQTADVEEPAIGRAMKAIVANPNDAQALATVSADPRYNAMLRTNVRGDDAERRTRDERAAAAGRGERQLPALSDGYGGGGRATFEKLINDTTVQVLVRSQRPPSPPTAMLPELMDPVAQITRDMWGQHSGDSGDVDGRRRTRGSSVR